MAESDMWQLNRSLPECNKYMLENEIATDVTFMVENNVALSGYRLIPEVGTEDESECDNPQFKKARKHDTELTELNLSNCESLKSQSENYENEFGTKPQRFVAHKYVLISRSPVFRAMLTGPLAEKDAIKIEDIEPEAFEQMLNYMYTDNADLTLDNLLPVIYVSRKYLLPKMEKLCNDFFSENLNASNACFLLEHCLCFQESAFAEKCMQVIIFQTKECLASESALSIQHKTLNEIVTLKLLATSELEIFKFCHKWGTLQCMNLNKESTGENIRDVLGNILHQINFTTISSEDIADIVLPTNILNAGTALSFFQCRFSKKGVEPPENFLNIDRTVNLQKVFSLGYFKNRFLSPELESFSCYSTMDVKIPVMLKKLYVSCPDESSSNTKINYYCEVNEQAQVGLSDSLHKQGNVRIAVLEFLLPILLDEGNHSVSVKFSIAQKDNSTPKSCNLYVTKKHKMPMSINSVVVFNIFNHNISNIDGDFFVVFGAEFSFHPRLFGTNEKS